MRQLSKARNDCGFFFFIIWRRENHTIVYFWHVPNAHKLLRIVKLSAPILPILPSSDALHSPSIKSNKYEPNAKATVYEL